VKRLWLNITLIYLTTFSVPQASNGVEGRRRKWSSPNWRYSKHLSRGSGKNHEKPQSR